MKVGLFIPCYVDQFYPQVGIATLRVLERAGCEVVYPAAQTCCGQPMANSGFAHLTRGCDDLFIRNFEEFEYIVSPSGSCVLHIREHLHAGGERTEGGKRSAAGERTVAQEQVMAMRSRIFELTEFLTDIAKIEKTGAKFFHKVGMHQSCHGQRGLHLSQMTELVGPAYSKPERLLQMVEGIELVGLDREDECCGFGGTFCVAEEAVSVKMGKDRITDHLKHGVEYITGSDMSCLMHLEGILRREKSAMKVIHIAEILNAI